MQIQQVTSPADIKKFIELPYRLYRDDPLWVPPLKSEQHGQFEPRKNPMLDHCEYALFLLRKRWTGHRAGIRFSGSAGTRALEATDRPVRLI